MAGGHKSIQGVPSLCWVEWVGVTLVCSFPFLHFSTSFIDCRPSLFSFLFSNTPLVWAAQALTCLSLVSLVGVWERWWRGGRAGQRRRLQDAFAWLLQPVCLNTHLLLGCPCVLSCLAVSSLFLLCLAGVCLSARCLVPVLRGCSSGVPNVLVRVVMSQVRSTPTSCWATLLLLLRAITRAWG